VSALTSAPALQFRGFCIASMRAKEQGSMVACLMVGTASVSLKYFDGPSNPAGQVAWLANLTASRQAMLQQVNYNDSVYIDHVPWVAPQCMAQDTFIASPGRGPAFV
jgi:hypothetical protein